MDSADERTKSHVAHGAGGSSSPRMLLFWEGGVVTRDLKDGDVVTVGRSRECDVQIDHPSVSRRHVSVHATSPVRIEDLGSSNGTRVGGERVPPHTPTPLGPGQIAELGVVVLVVQQAPSAPARSPRAGSPTDPTEGSAMAKLRRLVELVAPSDLSVLVLGETGAGKEVIAAMLHARSPRADKPFFKINCAALSESLLESELFGHERGAFTGAVGAKPGLFEAADGGTLLLDEVGELPLGTQATLLRAVETHEVTRLGSVVPRHVDVRLLTATNRDLASLVSSGHFRRDFYYRINGITLTLPPLRERRDEIAPLARQFADEASARAGKTPTELRPEALDKLQGHDWPGNVRELRAVIERAIVLSGGSAVTPEHVILDPTREPARPDPDRVLPERERILEALERFAGNQTSAAKLLGISRRTLVTRLEEYGLPRPRKRPSS